MLGGCTSAVAASGASSLLLRSRGSGLGRVRRLPEGCREAAPGIGGGAAGVGAPGGPLAFVGLPAAPHSATESARGAPSRVVARGDAHAHAHAHAHAMGGGAGASHRPRTLHRSRTPGCPAAAVGGAVGQGATLAVMRGVCAREASSLSTAGG